MQRYVRFPSYCVHREVLIDSIKYANVEFQVLSTSPSHLPLLIPKLSLILAQGQCVQSVCFQGSWQAARVRGAAKPERS